MSEKFAKVGEVVAPEPENDTEPQKKYLTVKECMAYLKVADATARRLLGRRDKEGRVPTGQPVMLHSIAKVQRIKAELEKTPRKPKKAPKNLCRGSGSRAYAKVKDFDFQVDEHGRKVSLVEDFSGGRHCKYPGCERPVAKGRNYCKKHRQWYRKQQALAADILVD